MKNLKFIIIKIWNLISIFGLLIALIFFFINFYLIYVVHRDFYKNKISEHKFILNRIKEHSPTKEQFLILFGEEYVHYNSSEYLRDKRLTEDKKLTSSFLDYYFSFPSVKEKFEKYDSMIVYDAGSLIWFIFFDKEGRMVDFEIGET